MPLGGFGGGQGVNVGTAYAELEMRVGKWEAGLKQGQAGLERFQRDTKGRMESLGRSVESFGRTLTLAVTGPIVALGTAAVTSATRMDNLRRGLTAITGSSREASRQMERLKEAAKLPGIDFREAVQGSIRLQAAGFSAQQAERSIKAFANALAMVGGSKEDLSAVLYNLTQIASAGKLTGDELRETAMRVPQLRQAMIEAFGTDSTEALRKMGITGQQAVEGIVKGLEKLPTAMDSAQNNFDNFRQAMEQGLATIGDVLLPRVTEMVVNLTSAIEKGAKKFQDLPKSAQESILGTGGVAATISVAVLAVGTLATKLAEAKKGLDAMAKAMPAVFAALSKGAFVPRAPGGIGDWARDLAARILGQAPPSEITADRAAREGMAQGRIAVTERLRPESRTARNRPARVMVDPKIAARIQDIRNEVIKLTQGQFAGERAEAEAQFKEDIKLVGMARASERYRAILADIDKRQSEQTKKALNERLAAFQQIEEVGKKTFDTLIEEAGKTAAESEKFAETWTSSMDEMRESLRKSLDAPRGGPDALSGLFGGLTIEKVEDYTQSMIHLGKSFVATAEAARQMRLKQSDMAMLGGMGSTLGGSFNLDAFKRDAAKYQAQMQKGFDWMGTFASSLADEFYNSFSDGLDKLFGRNPLGKALARTISRWFENMIGKALDTLTDPNASGAQKGKAGKGLLGGIIGSAFGPIGGILGGLFGGMFAEGGTAPGRRWSIVGERGPELVYPSSNMEVVPLSRLAGAGAPGGVTVNMGGVVIRETADADRVMDRIAARLQTMQRVRG